MNYARKNWPESLDKYDKQEKQLGNRKSLSKTDPDATFMRMKGVFGIIKNNRNFRRRFRLQGMEKVEIEVGLLSIAHNLAKLAN